MPHHYDITLPFCKYIQELDDVVVYHPGCIVHLQRSRNQHGVLVAVAPTVQSVSAHEFSSPVAPLVEKPSHAHPACHLQRASPKYQYVEYVEYERLLDNVSNEC